LIVGTQTDLRDDAQVREKLAKQKMQPVRKEDGEKMAKELGAVKYVECSALTQFKLKDVFDEVSLATAVASGSPSKLSTGNRGGIGTTGCEEAQAEGQGMHSSVDGVWIRTLWARQKLLSRAARRSQRKSASPMIGVRRWRSDCVRDGH
jgi:hypothetical protein